MTTRRRTALLTLAAVTCVAALAAAPPRPAEAAVALPARDLPSAYDAQLRDSKSVPLGRAVNFGYCAKYSGSTCTKPVPTSKSHDHSCDPAGKPISVGSVTSGLPVRRFQRMAHM